MPIHRRGALLLAALLFVLPVPGGSGPRAQAAGDGTAHPGPGALRASRLVGLPVVGMDHVRVGSIDDLLIGDGGRVEAVVVAVGGFLGVGEKHVAVPYAALGWNMKNVPLTSGPTSVTTLETAPGPGAAAGIRPETMPGSDTTREVLGAVQNRHTGRVTATTGSGEALDPTPERATVSAGGEPIEAEIRMTRAQLDAAPAYRHGAASGSGK